MRKLILAALFAVLPSIMFPSIASAQSGYIEGAVGFGLFPDINTSGYTHNTPVVTPYAGVFVGNAQVQTNSSWAFGAEAGYRTGNWRFGASWDFVPAEVDVARIQGTLNGVPFSIEATDQQLQDFGIDANYDVNVFAANAYYHFVGFGVLRMTADPYIGLGLGAATFSHLDSQFAFLVTLGANVPLGSGTYIGARYRGTFISGPSRSADNVLDTAIEFGGITIHTFSLIFWGSTSEPERSGRWHRSGEPITLPYARKSAFGGFEMKDYFGAARRYREHADELRKIARELKVLRHRTWLPTVADEYDQKAQWAEKAGRLGARKSARAGVLVEPRVR